MAREDPRGPESTQEGLQSALLPAVAPTPLPAGPLHRAAAPCRQIVSVSGGAFHSLAADERGNVYGWGDGDGASLGLQLTQDQLEPRQNAQRAACFIHSL